MIFACFCPRRVPRSASRLARIRSLGAGVLTLALLLGLWGLPCAAYAGQAAPKPGDTKAADKGDKAQPAPVLTEDNEVKVGRENAEENDKHVKLVTDAALVERVNRIGQEIAAVANSTPVKPLWGSPQIKQFKYTFKIVDDKDVNAYSLPGGFIYVNKGLLDYVHSDDELAGVLAHEISHAAHHHMVKLMHEQNKIQNILLPALVAAGVIASAHSGGNVGDVGNLLNAGYLYMIAKMNTYGVKAEEDADHSGILLLTHTHYNPVGLYSFMLRLANEERHHPQLDLGILRTHPPSDERAAAAKDLLDQQKIPIRLSDVDPTLRVTVTLIKNAEGKEEAELRTRGVLLCRVVGIEGQTAEQRGLKIAKQLNGMLDTQLQPFEVRTNPDQTKVLVRGVPILTEDDAAAEDKTIPTLAHEMGTAITSISQRQQLSGL